MKDAIIASQADHPAGRIRLQGEVAGVDACELVADRDEIVVGAGLDCDLAVPDPLLPARAFRLVREKCHRAHDEPCACTWRLEAWPRARVFVNNQLATREKLAFRDAITAGCHRFRFTPADEVPRNRRANTNVSDVCAGLAADHPVPPGFLAGTPTRQYWRRRQQALAAVGAIGLLAVLVFLLIPREERFEAVQPPLDVMVVAERLPAPDAVRSLQRVQRQTFTPQAPAPDAAIATPEPPALKPLEADPIPLPLDLAAPEPARFDTARSELPALAPAPVPAPSRDAAKVSRDVAKLGETAPLRRLSISEAQQRPKPSDLSGYAPRLDAALPAASAARPVSNALAAAQAPSAAGLATDRQVNLKMLEAFAPSPVRFEDFKGNQIPVVRIAEQLAQLDTPAGSAGIELDGTVTTAETALCWKSGQLRKHMPGSPPPLADPPTYCYVGRAEVNGRPCLYVSFVCADRNLEQLVTRYGTRGGRDRPELDDSIEIFLDVNGDRKDFHQLIVTAHGKVWTAYQPKPHSAQPWDAQATAKTTINKQAGQWTCEVFVPFDRLGGVPAKGVRWTVNFCRNFRGQGERGNDPNRLQSWFEIATPSEHDFHHPSRFGVFEW